MKRTISVSLLPALFFGAIVSGPGTAQRVVLAEDEPPLWEQIDRLVAAGTPGYEELAAPLAADAEFLRRVTLDLTGTIPHRDVTREFLDDPDPDKRARAIDRLLASPEYARHMQRTFDVILMRRLPAKNVSAAEWRTFLRGALAANKPYDEIAREILAADGLDPKNRGPARFYLDRDGDVDAVTRDVARIFLGADLQCAQCHDHPEVTDFLQQHYYGISAFLVRSFVFKDPKLKKAVFAEKAEGEVKFRSVFIETKEDETTPPRIFDGTAFEDPKLAKDALYKVKPAKNVRPVPTYSRRQKLARAVASAENRRFARTAANRLWALMMGRGLVHPVGFDHSGNPPSHPELLDVLTDALIEHRFDVKWYLRELTLSKTYQRSSRVSAGENDASEIDEAAFAQAIMKPLSPAQLAWAMLEGTGTTDVHRAALGEKLNEETLYQRLDGIEERFVSLFAEPPGELPRDFDSRVDQVLFLSNDPTVVGLVTRKTGNLADRAAKLPADNPQAVAEELFLTTLSRRPSEEDVRDVEQYLKGLTGDERGRAMEELVWALVTTAEFRFNH